MHFRPILSQRTIVSLLLNPFPYAWLSLVAHITHFWQAGLLGHSAVDNGQFRALGLLHVLL